MNRMLIKGHHIDRIQCEHGECLELHRLRHDAFKLAHDPTTDRATVREMSDVINHIEKRLSLCPNQPKLGETK